MATNTSRLTNTGTLLVNGSFDEVTYTTNKMAPNTIYSAGFDEVFMSSGSIQFNGSSQYLSFPGTGLTLSATNFTMEAYVYLTGYSAGYSGSYASNIFGAQDSSNNGLGWYVAGTASSYTSLNVYGANGGVNISTTYSFSLNTWYHVVATHTAAGAWQFYINGVAVSTTNSAAGTWTLISPYTIGYLRPSYQYYFPGYISNFRLIIGTILYTSSFTPPIAPLASIANTALLLNTSLNTNSAFLDSGPNNLTVTRVGTPTTNITAPFGQGSITLNGTSSVLTATNTTTLAISTGNWTIESWVYPTSSPSAYQTVASKRTGNNAEYEFGIAITTGYLYFYVSTTVYASTTVVSTNTWTHLAITWDGSNLRMFQNGVLTKTQAGANAVGGSAALTIGNSNVAGSQWFPGYITNLRITKGQAIYTSAFTPPVSPLTTSANTSLLLSTSAYAPFADSSVNNYTLTLAGSPGYISSTPFTVTGLAARQLSNGTLQVSGYFDETTGFL
jgi:hypothetical protein